MKKFVALIATFAASGLIGIAAVIPQTVGAATVDVTTLQAGDLIRGESFPAVYYYGKDGFRYVFPTDRIFFSWYTDFNSVKWVSDADLATIQIGGNVTYKPGYKMVKINTDPKTYAVDAGGTIRWVTSEDVAISLYGTDWNTKIDDVADAFFGNYTRGSDIEDAGDYILANVEADTENIDDDKDLQAPTYITITDDAYSDVDVTIKAGTAIRWTNMGTNKHTATADDLSWGTGTLTNGQHFSRYFNTPGTYEYFCSYHPEMTATITVE